ncbi:MAG: BatD family protein [Bacteroides sp.]|nr:BatD family protein [Bacteroides sp.]MCM1379796.1 BatD family protein [Bacteroides sp.]MCM1446155.1 BatD family protein [Prevotella sp.]
MIRRIFISLIVLAGALTAALGQTSVEISLPRNARVGQRFTVSITVNNPDGNVQTPKALTLSGCTFVGGPGTSTSSSINIINGHMQRSESRSYTFTYLADEEGTVKVPSVTVTVDGKQYSTQPGQFAVGAGQPAQQGGGSTSRPGRNNGDFEIGPNDLYMRVALSNNNVYEQQAVEVSIKLYSSNQQIEGLSTSSLPAFDGCLIESLGMPQTIDWHSETVGGRQMYSAVVYRALLYPQRAGEITLSGGEYTAQAYRQTYVQDFFGYRPVMESKEVKLKPHLTTLKVKALPQPKPANFSGAVGRFKASARLIGNVFKTNEAASIIYTIEGTGNIKFLAVPKVDFPSEFEVYEPAVDNNARVSGANMTGTETVEYTFVPQSVGKFKIGEYDFVYFDPSAGEYKTVAVEGFEIDVRKGANVSSAAVGGKQDVQAKNTDIHHIKVGADTVIKPHTYMAKSAWYWLAYPLLLIITLAIAAVYYKHQQADPNGRKLNRAGKVARKRLAKAGKLLKAKQYDGFYEELLRAMNSYLSDKLQIPASQMSRDTLRNVLAQRGATDELQKKLSDILNDCEMARYTPQTSGAAENTYDAAREVIDTIENLK